MGAGGIAITEMRRNKPNPVGSDCAVYLACIGAAVLSALIEHHGGLCFHGVGKRPRVFLSWNKGEWLVRVEEPFIPGSRFDNNHVSFTPLSHYVTHKRSEVFLWMIRMRWSCIFYDDDDNGGGGKRS